MDFPVGCNMVNTTLVWQILLLAFMHSTMQTKQNQATYNDILFTSMVNNPYIAVWKMHV